MLFNLLVTVVPVSRSGILKNVKLASRVFQTTVRSAIGRTKNTPASKRFFIFGATLLGSQPLKQYAFSEQIKPVTVVVKPQVNNERDRYFLRLLLHDIWLLIGSIIAAVVAAYINIQIPLRLGDVVNSLMQYEAFDNASTFIKKMWGDAHILVLLYLGQAAATTTYITFLSWLGENVAYKMKTDVFRNILSQDIAFFDIERTGALMEYISNDVQEFKSSFKLFISHGLRSSIQICGSVISLFLISRKMSGVIILILPIVIAVGTLAGGVLRQMSKEAQARSLKAVNSAQEAISSIRTVRAFANEDAQLKIYSDELLASTNIYKALGAGIGILQGATNLFLNGLILGTVLLGADMLQSQTMTPGSLMSFIVTTQTIQRSFTQLSLLFGQVVKGFQAAGRISQMVKLTPTIPLEGGARIGYHSFIPTVEFKNVTFAYPTRMSTPVLKKLNLTIPAGKKVAIVGASGNGKSTIASLLVRYYDVMGGSISVGGKDIRQLDPRWLRGTVIGIINQEPVLFATSVKENIRYGRPSASDEEVIAAAKLANAHEFIESFPEGYSTVVGERGVTVSGGQKQRIAIARALIKNPSILILDEATSALDPESEKQVQATLEKISQGRTVLVIAHRLSTIKDAHLIVVLNKGEIVEMGNHDQLVSKKGAYYHLMAQESEEAKN